MRQGLELGKEEWRLRREIFDEMQTVLGRNTVDRFSSAHNAQLPRYNSEFADPQAEAVNALTQDWRGEDNWIFPPIDLLQDIAQKLREQPAAATVVCPYWPSYAWFRELRELSCQMIVRQNAARQA